MTGWKLSRCQLEFTIQSNEQADAATSLLAPTKAGQSFAFINEEYFSFLCRVGQKQIFLQVILIVSSNANAHPIK